MCACVCVYTFVLVLTCRHAWAARDTVVVWSVYHSFVHSVSLLGSLAIVHGA